MPNNTVAALWQSGRQVLEAGYDKETAQREARLLLQWLIPKEAGAFLLAGDFIISPEQIAWYHQALERRLAGEPLQYILGEQEFMSLPFTVNASVLIPRWDTEILVEACLSLLQGEKQPIILDMGTGSGAIAISLAFYLPKAVVLATDISADALAVAEENAKKLGVSSRVSFFASDRLQNIAPEEQYDLLVSNPPYLTETEMAQRTVDLQQEPQLALYGGPDGLEFYRYLSENAWRYIKPGGHLAMEIGFWQKDAVLDLLWKNGWQKAVCHQDYGGHNRAIIAQKA